MERKIESAAINGIMVTQINNDSVSLVPVLLHYNFTLYYSLSMILKNLNLPDFFLLLNKFKCILLFSSSVYS